MEKPVLTEDLCIPIAVFLDSYPQASRVFIRNRMWCIGCAFARFHTLKDAIEIYQLKEETFLGEVRDLLSPNDDLTLQRHNLEKPENGEGQPRRKEG